MKRQLTTLILLTCLMVMSIIGCTDNKMAREFGGKETIDLPTGERVMNVTWKGTDVWVLTQTDTSVKPTTVSFKEKSSLGVWEGEIVINEH